VLIVLLLSFSPPLPLPLPLPLVLATRMIGLDKPLTHTALPGTLALALPLPNTPLIVLQGGGTSPLYPPNKAIIYHDGLGAAVAELEFGCVCLPAANKTK
jgi:hypothetical protein